MDTDVSLTSLRAFRAVIREGSFTAAALSLRTPKSTLSKRVADLEADLGVRLIERTTRQLRVTQEGEVLAARADRLLAEADDLRRALGEQGGLPRGHLRVAVPQVMGAVVMGRIASQFRALYPEITLEVHFLDRAADLLDEGFDGCIRLGLPEDSQQVARLMTHANAVLVAAPGLPGLDAIAAPSDLDRVPLVGMTTGWGNGWPLEHGTAKVELALRPGLVLGSYPAVRDAVLAGAGVALLPYLLAEPEIAEGRLVRVLPGWASPRKGLYFLYPSAHSVTARLRVFIDYLAHALHDDAAAAP
jgi:DNA-binding transcriptional LysR family regulator